MRSKSESVSALCGGILKLWVLVICVVIELLIQVMDFGYFGLCGFAFDCCEWVAVCID